eukprot:gb/GFBE01008680.1/.p1 GENE.gb/GFBE01008680.1/~~gb/GFBE01008680.1/.p1  ORF type:complete len:122 (+),score=28.52 gb/GFBE01008680.1/:1-366(+)
MADPVAELGHDDFKSALVSQERLNCDLRKAASLCDVRALRRAIARGADVNARAQDQLGQAALHLASQWRCKTDVGNELLAAGADPRQKDDLGLTALDRAKIYSNFKMRQLLQEFDELKHGV